jgi:lipopolysaccharide transport system permease protein
MHMIQALWAYRGFVLGSVRREYESKYRNSLLGALWTIINPLTMIVVYTVIFAKLMQAKLPGIDSTFGYSIYLCIGVLTWGLFTEIVSRSQNVFLENANLLKKISFPRLCLPVIVVLNAGMNFAIIFGLFTIFLIVSGNFPGLVFIALIPVLAIQVLFSVGLGITVGVLNVFFRDVGQLFGVILQFWFWLTPVVYPISILPSSVQKLIQFNPMVPLLTAYHDIVVMAKWPVWDSLWPLALLALLLCWLGMSLFRKHAGEMVDEL